MNECKFRVWDKENREMIELANPRLTYGDGGMYKLTFGVNFHDDFYEGETKDHVLMQFTGLKDKNGVEIYEGDVVLLEGVEKSVVIFWEGGFCYENSEKRLSALRETPTHWREVIGNIHEHPELFSQSGGPA